MIRQPNTASTLIAVSAKAARLKASYFILGHEGHAASVRLQFSIFRDRTLPSVVAPAVLSREARELERDAVDGVRVDAVDARHHERMRQLVVRLFGEVF